MKIWRKTIQSPFGKFFTLYLVFNLVFPMFSPSVAFALTGGPSQPEFSGFSEIGTDNMVDPFTGDFSYEIPLLSVPGPNGGYPIKINYAAGAGMESEASWVGLGWTLNPGAINRDMRGIPDDFSGLQEDNEQTIVPRAEADIIKKRSFVKNNVTVSIGSGVKLPPDPELYGVDASLKHKIGSINPNLGLYYNTYKGIGYRTGVGLRLNLLANESASGPLSAGFNLNFDSNDGASLQPSLSMSAQKGRTQAAIGWGFNYNSRQGITNTFLSSSLSVREVKNGKKQIKNGTTRDEEKSPWRSRGAGISFAAVSGVPSVSMAMTGVNVGFNLDFEAGAMGNHIDVPVSFDGLLSKQSVPYNYQTGIGYPSYGTLYSGYRDDQSGTGLMDFTRENDWPINIKSPMLPMPVLNHDLYSVTGMQMGGTFRAFRSDAGTFYEPTVVSNIVGVTIGVEVAASTGFKVGVDPSVTVTHSYSGKWKDEGDIKQLTETNFFRKKEHLVGGSIRTMEPFEFRFAGEMSPMYGRDVRFSRLGGNGAVNYTLFPATADFPDVSAVEFDDPDGQYQSNNLSFNPFSDVNKFKPKASNKVHGNPILANHTVRNSSYRKEQLVQYRTKNEIKKQVDEGGEPFLPTVFVTDPSIPMPSKTAFNMGQSAIKGHHVAEFSIIQTGGMKYVYGLPLYNRVHNEYYFAVKSQNVANKRISVPNLSEIMGKAQGDHNDKLYMGTYIGPYVHTYLITQIVSPDYIDVDNNGPSENDFGYWTKFNYHVPSIYKWRVPVQRAEANYIKGYDSNPNDQKGTITYGERDMTYLHSIETKTHVAVFYVSGRDDAREVLDSLGGINASSDDNKKLDSLVLYSKNDLTVPIKSVHFVYNYELCEDVDNRGPANSVYTYRNPVNGATVTREYKGKLTLKKIYFKYGNSNKGKLTPYQFEYGNVYKDDTGDPSLLVNDNTLNGNPSYKMMEVDRWGNYKPESINYTNEDFPYVDQSSSGADARLESATAWNLTDIYLPTGAHIKVAYEPDDYAHVQNKMATQMYRIAGTAKSLENDHIRLLQYEEVPITREHNIVLFHLDDPSATHATVKSMVNQMGNDRLYFKTWQRLQVAKGTYNPKKFAEDYVTGYAPIRTDGGYGVHEVGGKKYGYITLKDITEDNKNWNFFRKAGIQYLRHQRPDLDMPQNQGQAAVEAIMMIMTSVPMIIQSLEMISGYYNWALARTNCKFIAATKPSFIKLGVGDGVKYGGGHRVRKITIADGWSKLAEGKEARYGTEYFYHLTEKGTKISSGVAAYEPLVGGDENPFKKPHYYGPDSKFVHNSEAFYLEEPIGESYFPAPVVGYSCITMVNIANRKNKKTGDGVRVKEFYTAKDYPIEVQYTPQPQRIEDKQNIFIPFIAAITLKGYGYSQGYYIELNDMHGKPKSESTHDADDWNLDTNDWFSENSMQSYVAKKTYRYKTDSFSGRLDNTVDLLIGNREVVSGVMGETAEMFSEIKEDYSYSLSVGVQINPGIDPTPYGMFITLFPSFTCDEMSARTAVTTKVVYKNGILEEITDMAEGAVKKTKNLLYDAETGEPILTAVTTDYDDFTINTNDQNIYTYTYPAHWYYSGMQPAYKNYRNAYFFGSELAANNFPKANQYFERGDELIGDDGRIWVDAVAENSVSFIDAQGNPVASVTGEYVTVRSGKRNMQNVPAGNLVSLSNPVESLGNDARLDFYNQEVYGNALHDTTLSNKSYSDKNLRGCVDDQVYSGSISYNSSPKQIFINTEGLQGDCGIYIALDTFTEAYFQPSHARFYYRSKNEVIMLYDHNGSVIRKILPVTTTSNPPAGCELLACIPDVLNAQAEEFSDKWVYNTEFLPSGGPFANLNKYLKGELGIWRKLRTNNYFTERKQRSTGNSAGVYKTYIGKDGTYKLFVEFDWLTDRDTDGYPDGNANNILYPYGWRWMEQATERGYSPYGFPIESKNALGIFASELYGYKNSLVTATAQNALYPEIAFDGFEETPAGQPYTATGHLNFITLNNPASFSISNQDSHSGKQSLRLDPGGSGWMWMLIPTVVNPFPYVFNTFSYSGTLEFAQGKTYIVSFWYRFEGDVSSTIEVLIKDGSHPAPPSYLQQGDLRISPPIDKWRRVEVEFVITNYGGFDLPPLLDLNIIPKAPVYIDDIRIYPSDASYKTFVYDPKNFLLRAELDDNNYATFYNYDQENTLIQVKKETVEGTRTIQTTRKNVKLSAYQ